MKRTWTLALASLLLVSACNETPRTQIMVEIVRSSAVRDLAVVYRGAIADGPFEIGPASPGFDATVMEIAITPRDGDATNTFFASINAIDDEGTTIASATRMTGFVAEETRVLRLYLDVACDDCTSGCDPATNECVAPNPRAVDLPRRGAPIPPYPGEDAGTDVGPDAGDADTDADTAAPPDTATDTETDTSAECEDGCRPCEVCLDGRCVMAADDTPCNRCEADDGLCSAGVCLRRTQRLTSKDPSYGTAVEADGSFVVVGVPNENAVEIHEFDEDGCAVTTTEFDFNETDCPLPRNVGGVVDVVESPDRRSHVFTGGSDAYCFLLDGSRSTCICDSAMDASMSIVDGVPSALVTNSSTVGGYVFESGRWRAVAPPRPFPPFTTTTGVVSSALRSDGLAVLGFAGGTMVTSACFGCSVRNPDFGDDTAFATQLDVAGDTFVGLKDEGRVVALVTSGAAVTNTNRLGESAERERMGQDHLAAAGNLVAYVRRSLGQPEVAIHSLDDDEPPLLYRFPEDDTLSVGLTIIDDVRARLVIGSLSSRGVQVIEVRR